MHKMIFKILMAGTIAFAASPAHASPATATELRKQADILREKGESLKAIDVYNHAIVSFQEEKDYSNMMEALTGRLLSWRHLFDKTEDKIYAIFVQKEAEEMEEIAKEHKLVDKLFLIHYLNGVAAMLLNDFPVAEKEFNLAVESYPHENTGKGDWMVHLGDAMYRNGKKEAGKKKILQGIQFMEERSSQVDSFYYHVWLSGAYLRLAKLLKSDNAQESQQFLNKAKAIIDGDNRLVIRKQQLQAFMNVSK